MSDPNPLPASAAADAAAEGRYAGRRRGEQRRLQRALWQGAVGLLFGLVAVALALLAGWRVLGLERALDAERSAGRLAGHEVELLRAELAGTETRAAAGQAALARLDPLAGQLGTLDGRVDAIEARIAAPERAVARIEAAYLVEFAARRLALERDVPGAIGLLQAADARLAGRGDAWAGRARTQLERDVEALRAVAEPDVRSLAARLAAAEAAVHELPMLGAIRNQYLTPAAAKPGAPGLRRAWLAFTTSLSDLVSIRRVSDAAVRLVSMEEMGVRRQHLETLLFAARVAVLRADEADYATDLAAARDWLQRFFDTHTASVRGADEELAALAASRVSPALPDLSASLRLLRGPSP